MGICKSRGKNKDKERSVLRPSRKDGGGGGEKKRSEQSVSINRARLIAYAPDRAAWLRRKKTTEKRKAGATERKDGSRRRQRQTRQRKKIKIRYGIEKFPVLTVWQSCRGVA